MPSSSFSPSSSSACPWKYDVFLSFRGEDTRNNFVGHLYQSLLRKGLRTVIDDKQLHRGKDISSELLEAIEQSRLSVIVFSENYASSSWCLDELVKILECNQVKGQNVVPVFHKVDPSHVRKQQGSYAEAFNKHEKDYAQEMEKVQIWRTAFEKAGSISGWDTDKTANGHEATCIQEITNDIYKKLGSPISSIIAREQGLVGIDSQAEKVYSMLDVGGSSEVRVVGIWGMGGIGKTTLARVVYDRIVHLFEDSIFLAIREFVKERGLEALRKELNSLVSKLCHQRVLVVLDDAYAIELFDAFPVSYSWAGLGSRVIITSRDAHLLARLGVGVDTRYDVEALDTNEALRLFSLKAFNESNPPRDYVYLSHQMLHYASGLPLALVDLGASLFGYRHRIEWEDTLGKLKKVGNKDILTVLEISYDRLDELEKQIFLDIVCFFQGKSKDFVRRIHEGCGFHPIIGIKALIERSLVTVSSDNCLEMHDLIQEMGRHIVRKEDKEPGRRSRIWDHEEAYRALTENTVSDTVEGLSFCSPEPIDVNLNPEVFRRMNKLRLLIIRNARIYPGPDYLSSQLRLLEWEGYPSNYLPASFMAEHLVELQLRHTNITELWRDKKIRAKLKTICLHGNRNLVRTPDLTWFPNLEKLILSECTGLVEVHTSTAFHKKLTSVRLDGCEKAICNPSRVNNSNSANILLAISEPQFGAPMAVQLAATIVKKFKVFVIIILEVVFCFLVLASFWL